MHMDELKAQKIWFCWKYEIRKEKKSKDPKSAYGTATGTNAEYAHSWVTYDEAAVRNAHGTYPEEIVPKYYRLRSVNGISPKTAEAYTILCPLCGKGMTPITRAVDEHRLALYCCRNCKK